MIFLCTEIIKGEAYGRDIEAASWAEAQAECDRRHWHLEGTLESLIDAETGETIYDRQETEKAVMDVIWKES